MCAQAYVSIHVCVSVCKISFKILRNIKWCILFGYGCYGDSIDQTDLFYFPSQRTDLNCFNKTLAVIMGSQASEMR